MKAIIFLFTLIGILTLLTYSCEENQKVSDDKNQLLTGKLSNYSECKLFKTTVLSSDTPDTLSCINYTFDISIEKLTIKHINAGFNCCPESLYCNVSVNQDTIIIQEFEKESACKCNCLYDLNIEVNGIDSKKYYLKIIEQYSGEQEKIFLELDLTDQYEDTYCVTRKNYPWGMEDYYEDNTSEFSGQLMNYNGCKYLKSGNMDNRINDTGSCIHYTFDANSNKLILNHNNAEFNCCPDSLYSNITLNQDTIVIQEIEKASLCYCTCTYDLNFKLEGINSKKYYIKIESHYANNEKLSFELDLEDTNVGSHCVP